MGILIVTSEQEITIEWNEQSLSNGNVPWTTNVMVKVFEADICEESISSWVSETGTMIENSVIDNRGRVSFELPTFQPRSDDHCLVMGQLKSPYSLVLVKLIIDPSSYNNKYYNAIRNLQRISTESVEVGIWSHVLLTKNSSTTASICSSWHTFSIYHDVSFMNVAPCPCTKDQANEQNSGYNKRNTAGKELIDAYLHGMGSTCYDQNENEKYVESV